MANFSATQKIGEIVTNFPKAADVFKEYKIDFCCGGDRPLSRALTEQGLSESEIIGKLETLYQELSDISKSNIDWTKESLSKLIDHIIAKHHTYLQVELPRISELVTKILRAHGANHPELSKVHKLFHSLKAELEQHLIKEEEIEFPLIKEYERHPSQASYSKAIQVISELESEHEGAGDIFKELRKITNDYTLPEDACPTFEAAFNKLIELESDTFQHIHLENNILFPLFKALNKDNLH